MIWYLEGKETYSFIQSKCCNDDNNLRKQATKHFSHEGIARLAGPGHVADGPGGQNSYRGEVAERESQNYRQTPDTNDDTGGGLRRQTRLQRVDDGHVPKGQRSVSLSINLLTYTKETKLSLTTLFKPFWKVYFITLISIYLGSRTKVKQLLLGNIHGWWWNTHLSGSRKHHSHGGLSSCSCTSHIHMKGFRIGVKGWSNLSHSQMEEFGFTVSWLNILCMTHHELLYLCFRRQTHKGALLWQPGMRADSTLG